MVTGKPEKPLYGAPCNGCGLCCLNEQCPLSEMLFGAAERCPALLDVGSRYACGLIVEPGRYVSPGMAPTAARLFGEMLGIGRYCDAIENAADEVVAAIMERARHGRERGGGADQGQGGGRAP